MKKTTILFSLLLFTSVLYSNAQENIGLTHRHEIKLNLGSTLFSFPEVSYEYILSEDITVGAAVGFSLTNNISDDYKFKTTPFVRWFFIPEDQQPATGFFLEANGLMGSQDIYKYNSSTESQVKEYNHFAAGLGLAGGWKYLSKNNWTAELFLGGGRNFIYDNAQNPVYGRFGIYIGKRF